MKTFTRLCGQFAIPACNILAYSAAALMLFSANLLAAPSTAKTTPAPRVEIALALDVSGSMDGLIESAKQRLWDIVNELALAEPQPEVRVALLTYGAPSYGKENGYVRLDLGLTSDLDAANSQLFALTTSGGDEYVARVIHHATEKLDWSSDPQTLKLIFVAGNESAEQDARMTYKSAAAAAIQRGIQVNTIFCGSPAAGEALGWREVAALADGTYASINQAAATAANIATPMDSELVRLNGELNDTYVAYGSAGRSFKENQVRQDSNTLGMSPQALASRTATKASSLYRNEGWDLVDALKGGKELDEIPAAELPKQMRELDQTERKKFVESLTRQRESIQKQIEKLHDARRTYIAAEHKKLQGAATGLDAALIQSIRSQAQAKGFTFSR